MIGPNDGDHRNLYDIKMKIGKVEMATTLNHRQGVYLCDGKYDERNISGEKNTNIFSAATGNVKMVLSDYSVESAKNAFCDGLEKTIRDRIKYYPVAPAGTYTQYANHLLSDVNETLSAKEIKTNHIEIPFKKLLPEFASKNILYLPQDLHITMIP